jgi:serine/threonine protein kinase
MKSVKRDNPRAEQFKRLRQQRLPTSSHTPLADRLNTTEAKIRKEIAIMKKCRHPHVVRLYEVIDDRMRDKIYMGESSLLHVSAPEAFLDLYTWHAPTTTKFLLSESCFTYCFSFSDGVSRRRRSKLEEFGRGAHSDGRSIQAYHS